MRVSRNEMIAALSRAYEGAGHHIGDYEDAAQLVAWSHMCGLGGFDRIALPPAGPKGGATPRLIFESGDIAVIDAGGADVCEYGMLAAHLAFAKAERTGFSIVELSNCRYPVLVLHCLSIIARQGAFVLANWTDQAGSHGASFEGGACFPHYWRVDHADCDAEISTVTIICSNRPGVLADSVTRQSEHPEMQRFEMSAAQLAANYNQSLEQGVAVIADRWDALNAAAWPILVPSDPNSRAGAGPG